MKNARDAVFGSHPLLAPRLLTSILSGASGWQKLPLIDSRFTDCVGGLYQLESLKPDRGYSDLLRIHCYCLQYLALLGDLSPLLASQLVGICTWNVPRAIAPPNIDTATDDIERHRLPIAVSSTEEELFLALYNGAASLMQMVVILSNQLDNENVLKLCIKLLITADAWWSILKRLRSLYPALGGAGNERVSLVNPPGDNRSTINQLPCFNNEALGIMSSWVRAQLAELWVRFYLSRPDKQRDFSRMCFVCSTEYGLVYDGALAGFANDEKLIDTMDMLAAGNGPRTLGRLHRTAAVKRFYYLAQACLARVPEGSAESSILLNVARETLERALKSLHKVPNAFEAERYNEFEADINYLTEECKQLEEELGLEDTKETVDPNQLTAILDAEGGGSGDALPGLLHRELYATAVQHIPLIKEDIQRLVQALKTTLPPPLCNDWIGFDGNLAKIASLIAPREVAMPISPVAERTEASANTTTSDEIPSNIINLFSERNQAFSSINRLGLIAKKLAKMRRDGVLHNAQTSELMNEQLTALINITALLFFPPEQRIVEKIIGLSRAISERQWPVLVNTYQPLICEMRRDPEVLEHMELVVKGQMWLRNELELIERAAAAQ